MSKSKQRAPARPAIEYVLIAIAIVLFVAAIWVFREINAAYENERPDQATSAESGTPEETESLTQQDISTELTLDESEVAAEQEADQAAEGAADGIGGIYDETTY